ncbi:alpha/beta hydrolase [Alteromonas sp. 5E99-2]|uniref:alpha/beta hydrolase n=1 Tax=Alteromonas sp. 5E99-2 TaxID=2817683 RepID=UPI001A981295|nr:alpha/beta hydrolase-fold protein [Alteromonas sp. 5E99-2]MBO1255750.1 alpha/beta hydrolase [Alteromonas sp. 5E99-2]
MNKIISTVLLFIFASNAIASEIIELGTSNSLESKIMEERRSYMVYLPPSYHESKNRYPVIYLLDGDVHRFKGFVGVLESLSTETLGSQVQQAIVVAIPNTNRSRDLTPSTLIEWKFKNRVLDTFSQTGEAARFTAFLNNELIINIENSYRTSDKRILVGESFGGLFAANALLYHPLIFTDYLIIDPTALWDNDYLNRTYDANFKKTKFDINVFFAFANNSHLGEIGLTNFKWGSMFASSIISNTDGFAEQQFFENETHGTVALLAWYEGLKALLPTTEE